MCGHDDAVEIELDEYELNPFVQVTAADHTDEYQDPELRNGRQPDIVAETILGTTILDEGETEHGVRTHHSREQINDLQEFAQSEPGAEFELSVSDDDYDEDACFDNLGW